jgi:hypothetical protein
MEVNYLGSYAVAQAFLPLLLKTAPKRSSMDRPSIIMVNSFNSQVRDLPCPHPTAALDDISTLAAHPLPRLSIKLLRARVLIRGGMADGWPCPCVPPTATPAKMSHRLPASQQVSTTMGQLPESTYPRQCAAPECPAVPRGCR